MGASASCKTPEEVDEERTDKPLGGVKSKTTDVAFDAGDATTFGKNEIREVQIAPDFTILVSEFEGKFYGYGNKCPHYGAPLKKGALRDGMIRCPWHGACFDIRTGDIEDHPGICSIPTYPVVKLDDGHLQVYPNNFGVYKIDRPLGKITDRSKLCVVLGAGAAALAFVQTLRELSYEGRILMISRDRNLPYDRTKLSKSVGCSWEDIQLRSKEWFNNAEIEVMLQSNIISLDVEKSSVLVEGQAPIIFNHLLIATGARPRIPKTDGKGGVVGADLKNVLTLYDIKDSARISEQSVGNRVVIMGSGFIAMELIAPLHKQCTSITILSRGQHPYGAVYGADVGRAVEQFMLKKFDKLTFLGGDQIVEIGGNSEGKVEKVITTKGKEIPCDIVIYAIGAVPNTEYIPLPSPLDIPASGLIPVSKYMETCVKEIYAAGDVASIPLDITVPKPVQVAHWGMAQKMGRIAAKRLMGQEESIFKTVPFFWTNVGGVSYRYVGYGHDFNQIVIFGDLNAMHFCVVYKRDSKIIAVLTCNCDPIAAKMCFDLQDQINYDNSYPACILTNFPDPPIVVGADLVETVK